MIRNPLRGVLVNRIRLSVLMAAVLIAAQFLAIPQVDAAAAWYNTSWTHRVEIAINHTALTGNVTDLVIPITGRDLPASFWSMVDSSGADIVVTGADGITKLKRQVAYLNTTSQVMEIYTAFPLLDATADTTAWLYWGNGAANETDDADTWPAEWVFASPMADYNSGTQIKDFSQYGNHGTKGEGSAAPTEVAGLAGMAQEFTASQYVSMASRTGITGSWSVVALWKRLADSSGSLGHLPCRYVAGHAGQRITVNSNGTILRTNNYDTTDRYADCDGLSASDWNVLFGIYDADEKTITAQANALAPVSAAVPGTQTTGATPLGISAASAAVYDTEGLECELWVYAGVLSPDEIAAIDAALRGTATFYSVGTPEVLSVSSLTATATTDHEISLSWLTDAAITNTTIRAAIGRVPVNIYDGYLVYSGNATSATDWVDNLEMLDNKLYYAAWGTNDDGVWTLLPATTYIEGVGMKLIALVILCLGILVFAWHMRKVSLLFVNLMCWMGLTAYAFSLSDGTMDFYRMLGWVGIAMALLSVYQVVNVLRVKPEIEDVDPVVEGWQDLADMRQRIDMMMGRGIPPRRVKKVAR